MPANLTYFQTNITCNDEQVEKYLHKSFNTLETVILQDNNITGSCLLNMKNVRNLELENLPHLDQKILQEYFQMNKNIKHLKLLVNIINSSTISAIFQFLQDIETIDIEAIMVHPIKVYVDFSLLKDLKSLRKLSLNIGGNYVYTQKIIQMIANLNLMERLDLYHNLKAKVQLDEDSLNYFKNLNLKVLSLNHCNFVDDNFFKILSTNKINELHLYNCLNFTCAALETYLIQATNLNVLNIKFCVLMKRTAEFIRDLENEREHFKAELSDIISCEPEPEPEP